MALYVVVHHRRDQQQPWANRWTDDNCLEAISTTPDIAARCRLAKDHGERVFVHRCGWEDGPPRVCCSLVVADAKHDEKIGWVRFRDPEIRDDSPSVHPGRGQNSYEAPAPDSV